MDQPLMFLVIGAMLILVASLLQTYCEFGRLARPDMKPGILKSWFRWVMEGLWVLMLLAGGVLLLLSPGGWVFALIGVVAFWLVLPFMVTPIMRNRLLPPWDEVKSELATKRYSANELHTERNYWRGDWWMREDKQGKGKKKAS